MSIVDRMRRRMAYYGQVCDEVHNKYMTNWRELLATPELLERIEKLDMDKDEADAMAYEAMHYSGARSDVEKRLVDEYGSANVRSFAFNGTMADDSELPDAIFTDLGVDVGNVTGAQRAFWEAVYAGNRQAFNKVYLHLLEIGYDFEDDDL